MNIDFHYATVYVLSRWAKFSAENSHTIASSSQMVDENFDDNPFSDKAEQENIAAGVNVRYSCQNVWNNITGKGNAEIWIPFHFLPGLEGKSDTERLVCKKNGVLAKRLKECLSNTSLNDQDFGFRLGIGLHVYADTWAHQEFAGINNRINDVQNLIFTFQGSLVKRVIDDLGNSKSIVSKVSRFMTKVLPLGHAAAVHCPDMPFLWWKSDERFLSGRKNWDEFLEASDSIFKILQSVKGGPVTGLSEEQRKLLYRCFKGIQFEDPEDRLDAWLDRIHKNFFKFEDFNEFDHKLAYDKDFIFGDIALRKRFYDEINAHFDWVLDQLEEADMFVLKSKAIF